MDFSRKDGGPPQRDGKELQASRTGWSAAIPVMRRRSLIIGVPISIGLWAVLIWMVFG